VGVEGIIGPFNLSAGSMFYIGPDLGSNLLLCFTIRPQKRLISAITGKFERYKSHRDHLDHGYQIGKTIFEQRLVDLFLRKAPSR
jgi:hypothetical protein